MSFMKQVELLRAACCVAGADGQTVKSEREILERIASDIGLQDELLELFIYRSERDEKFGEAQLRRPVGDSLAVLRFLFTVAAADRKVTVSELNALFRMAERLRISDRRFEQLRANVLDVCKAA